jgi:hypothetical protein
VTAFQNIAARLLQTAEDLNHHMVILPYQPKLGVENLTSVQRLLQMSQAELKEYTGNVYCAATTTNWLSFDLKIESSYVRLYELCRKDQLNPKPETPLQTYMREEQMSLVMDERWTEERRCILLLRGSHPADDPAVIKAELLARIQADQGIELQPELFELEWHKISKKSQQPVEDIVAGGLCVVTNFANEETISKAIFQLKPILGYSHYTTADYRLMHIRVSIAHNDSMLEMASQLQTQRDFLNRIVSFTISGVDPKILDEVPNNPAGLNVSEPNNSKTIRELLSGMKPHQTMTNLTSPILRITHSMDPYRITFLGEDSKCDEMKFVAPKVVEKLKLWGSFSASLDPALITSVNMGTSAKMALQRGSFAPGFTPPSDRQLSNSTATTQSPMEISTASGTPANGSGLLKMVLHTIETVANGQKSLAQEVKELKATVAAITQSNPPSHVTEQQTIVSDISSISTKIEAIEQKLTSPQALTAEVIQQITEAACEAASKSQSHYGPSEADQVILRSYIHESDILKLPDDARESDIILPLHGYEDLPPIVTQETKRQD